MAHITYRLVERQKVGTAHAYRYSGTVASGVTKDRGLAILEGELDLHPQRYAPTGTHTLVLLADERSGGAR